MLFKPFIALAVFALVVIPLKLVVLRYASPAWRALLSRKLSPVEMWTTWAAVMFIVIAYASIASDLW